jgi:hypothetical protein
VAQTTLPVLSHSEFPQVLTCAIDREISRVERILARHRPELKRCPGEHRQTEAL